MPLSAGQLNRATLARQLLLERERLSVADATQRLLALQAQQPASPYLALWNRIEGFDPADLDAAFLDQTIVKATSLRLTLHAAHRDDHPALWTAMTGPLRSAGLGDRRFTDTGLRPDDADALVEHLIAFTGQPRSRVEIGGMLAGHLGAPPDDGLWRALRLIAPLRHVPTGGPWSFGFSPSFGALDPPPGERDRDDAVAEVIRRYLAAFGPASARDVGQFTMLPQATVTPAIGRLTDELVRHEGPDGATLWDLPGAPIPDAEAPAPPRLLPMWDNSLLAYADRRRIIPDAYRPFVVRRNGDVLPTVLIDGYVRGVWRPVRDGIEVHAFEPWDDDAWEHVGAEAIELFGLLADRDPRAYARYDHWWDKLPDAQRWVLSS